MRKSVFQSNGFTLVELTIVLAISSLMITGVLMGQGSAEHNASFTSSVDSLANRLEDVRNQGTNSVKLSTTGVGNSSSSEVFGSIAILDKSQPTQLKTCTVLYSDTADNLSLTDCNTTTYEGGLQYAGNSTNMIMFVGHPQKVYAGSFDGSSASLAKSRYVDGNDQVNQTQDYLFTDGDGRNANVTVDPANGSIKRTAI